MESVLDFGVGGRPQCLQDQLQRAPRVWAGRDVQLMAVVPSVLVVGNSIKAKEFPPCRSVNLSPLSKLEAKVFVSQCAHAASNSKEFGEWRALVSDIGCFLRPPPDWV